MVMTPLYLGENKQEGFFNIPPKKKTNLFVKPDNNKNLADKVVESALKKIIAKEKKEK